jgi:uncharacterized coiled-coil protein SlyX
MKKMNAVAVFLIGTLIIAGVAGALIIVNSQQSDQISELTETIASQKIQIEKLSDALAARNSENANLKVQLGEKNLALALTQAKLDKSQAEVGRLNSLLATLPNQASAGSPHLNSPVVSDQPPMLACAEIQSAGISTVTLSGLLGRIKSLIGNISLDTLLVMLYIVIALMLLVIAALVLILYRDHTLRTASSAPTSQRR